MQVGNTTYSAQTMASIGVGEQSAEKVAAVEMASVEKTDRFEPSQAVLGAADTLPGQASPKFEVDGSFGFCQNCGTDHGMSFNKADGNTKTSEIEGTEIPDMHAILGEVEKGEEAVISEDKKEDAGPEAERDALTGEVELSEEERKQVEELKRRDQEVRTHEHAHVAAGGRHVRGGISYEYQTGPDGRRYAVGGEVSIDTAPESTPEDTIRKAQTIRQAALAPAEPSGQDRRAAAAAAQMEMKARQEMSQAKLEGEETGEEVLGASEEAGDEVLHNGTSQGVDKTAHDMPEGGLTKAEGVAVSEVQKQDGGGLSDVAQTKKKDGLPHTPAPTGAPVMQLDYGQNHRASGLVDMYG